MFYLLNYSFCFYFILFYNILISNAKSLNCHLPEKCRLENVDPSAIWCDINNDTYEFKFKQPTPVIITGEKCDINGYKHFPQTIIFRWTTKDLSILDEQFNFTNVISYFNYFKFAGRFEAHFWNLKGFDIEMLKNLNSSETSPDLSIYLANCPLDFYHKRRRINSCQDIIDSNLTDIESIFQIKTGYNGFPSAFRLQNVEYKRSICPLIFSNSQIKLFRLEGLVDTFYKKNVLSFSNDAFKNLISEIKNLEILKAQNIKLDLNLFHASVFKFTEDINIANGWLNSINENAFKGLDNLKYIRIGSSVFRKINHKQGINWIRQINQGVDLNVSRLIPLNFRSFKCIEIPESGFELKSVLGLPEEDFCIYTDFPFNQMVIVYKLLVSYGKPKGKNASYDDFTCTYLWLVQHTVNYYIYFKSIKTNRDLLFENFQRILNSKAFKSISKCNFTERISYCNKSNFQTKDIWDESDFFILNKKFQTAFKSLLYPTALFGLVTNIIIVVIILKKDNSDLFKGIKHYSYLWLNSIFCIMILVIELLSWITECFFPFEVFCPEIRKLVAIQFFKIIFKECFVTLFRFMCNFTYVAFALNRINLIGKDHGKIVTFFSEVGIKKYIVITLLISATFSWIKFFTYKVNHSNPEANYPITNELSIYIYNFKNAFYVFYFIFSFISSFVNYLLFVVITVIIDICMAVQLRRTLEDKSKKSESLNQKQNETKKTEFEEAVNKAIKMVVLNTAIGIFFKIPLSIIPLINLYYTIYSSQNAVYQYTHPYFRYIFRLLQDSEIYYGIEDMASFFFTLSLSIQMFIYKRFDRKFRTGYERLINRALFEKPKNNDSNFSS
jgi:hypothetical protein